MKFKLNYRTLTGGRSRVAAGLLGVLALTACTTSHVLVGERRPAISPDEVHLYLHPPAKYDGVALLSSSSRASFALTAQGRSDAVIVRLKKEAAALGANGILLQGVSDQEAGSLNSGWATGFGGSGKTAQAFGFGTSGTVFEKLGTGVAIYVQPDATAAR